MSVRNESCPVPLSRWQYETDFPAFISDAQMSFDCHAGNSMSFSYEQTSTFELTRANAASSDP